MSKFCDSRHLISCETHFYIENRSIITVYHFKYVNYLLILASLLRIINDGVMGFIVVQLVCVV